MWTLLQFNQLSSIIIIIETKPRIEGLSERGLDSVEEGHCVRDTVEGQSILLKKKLQVCEIQKSCLFVGGQILIFQHNLQINS